MIRKAYALRDRVTERQRSHISALYLDIVEGDVEKATAGYKEWMQTYPRDPTVYGNLASEYMVAGKYQDAVTTELANLASEPTVADYENLIASYLALDRLDEAQKAIDDAFARKLDDPILHEFIYILAYLHHDMAKMEGELRLSTGKPSWEDLILFMHSNTLASRGQLKQARSFSRKAVESAQRAELKETSALWQADLSLRESAFGNASEAKQFAVEAIKIAPGSRDSQVLTALALARAGDTAHAQTLLDDLNHRFPAQHDYPSRLGAHDPRTTHFESRQRREGGGRTSTSQSLRVWRRDRQPQLCLPVSRVRAGRIVLGGKTGDGSGRRISKGSRSSRACGQLLDRALARLGVARGKALGGDTAGARVAYQDFLALWKDADPDIPILKQAKAEYAKLR
jgi:tetratricopeptide (TPR) repeat protein